MCFSPNSKPVFYLTNMLTTYLCSLQADFAKAQLAKQPQTHFSAILNSGYWVFLWDQRCALYPGCHVPTNFGVDWSNNENKMANAFWNSVFPQPPSWILIVVHLRNPRCVLHRIHNIPIKFGKKLAQCWRNGNCFSNIKMVTAAILIFVRCACFTKQLRLISDLPHSHKIWWWIGRIVIWGQFFRN